MTVIRFKQGKGDLMRGECLGTVVLNGSVILVIKAEDGRIYQVQTTQVVP